jgi:hypothetical protein
MQFNRIVGPSKEGGRNTADGVGEVTVGHGRNTRRRES